MGFLSLFSLSGKFFRISQITKIRCAAAGAEQKLRCQEYNNAEVCEAHFCSFEKRFILEDEKWR